MSEAPQPPAPQPAAPVGGPPAANPGKGLGIAGMILGIIGLVLLCVWYIGVPCAIVGLILSIMGRKKSKAANAPTGMATAGMVLSLIALGILILFALVGAAILAALGIGAATVASQMPNQPGTLVDPLRLLL
jgi:hypothetical protein